MDNDVRDHAVVLGGGMAGLLAARVLADVYRDVLIIDRDQLAGVTGPRRGVPHGRHAHALLAKGHQILVELFRESLTSWPPRACQSATWRVVSAGTSSVAGSSQRTAACSASPRPARCSRRGSGSGYAPSATYGGWRNTRSAAWSRLPTGAGSPEYGLSGKTAATTSKSCRPIW
jgi:hypothetical protein